MENHGKCSVMSSSPMTSYIWKPNPNTIEIKNRNRGKRIEDGQLEEGDGSTRTWSEWKKVERRELPIVCCI